LRFLRQYRPAAIMDTPITRMAMEIVELVLAASMPYLPAMKKIGMMAYIKKLESRAMAPIIIKAIAPRCFNSPIINFGSL